MDVTLVRSDRVGGVFLIGKVVNEASADFSQERMFFARGFLLKFVDW